MHTTVATQEPWSRRPQFAPRQLLDAERLNAALQDELERQRLLNLALHGWGVVFGFGVGLDTGPDRRRTQTSCLLVTCGLVLDPFGRMLHTEDRRLSLGELEGPVPSHGGTYTLLVHHAERLDPPVDDLCNGSGPQWREYGVVFSLRAGCEPVSDCCPDLAEPCLTRTDYVRRRIGAAGGSPGRSPDLEHACDRPGSLRSTRCGSWCYDPAAGVPVACLELCDRSERLETSGDTDTESAEDTRPGEYSGRKDHRPLPERECEAPCLVIDRVCTDECSPVRHVYRSPLLRELLSCCDVDLPRVQRVSWQAWTDRGGRVPWSEFSDRIQVSDDTAADDGFAIWFTRPVRADTLTAASIVLSAITEEELADYWTAATVPIDLQPLDVSDDLASGVQLVAQEEWLNAEVRGRRSNLLSAIRTNPWMFRLEITIRGQLLRDDCGHMLNAVPTDVGRAPCQGRPGDDLIWALEVHGPGPRRDRDAYESTRQEETT